MNVTNEGLMKGRFHIEVHRLKPDISEFDPLYSPTRRPKRSSMEVSIEDSKEVIQNRRHSLNLKIVAGCFDNLANQKIRDDSDNNLKPRSQDHTEFITSLSENISQHGRFTVIKKASPLITNHNSNEKRVEDDILNASIKPKISIKKCYVNDKVKKRPSSFELTISSEDEDLPKFNIIKGAQNTK